MDPSGDATDKAIEEEIDKCAAKIAELSGITEPERIALLEESLKDGYRAFQDYRAFQNDDSSSTGSN